MFYNFFRILKAELGFGFDCNLESMASEFERNS